MTKNVLAVIPARGGSIGIPKKNIKLVAGKPLIAWSIEEAKKAETVTRVVVSTDSSEIADVSKTYGAEVVVRPSELAGPLSSSESALLHVLSSLKEAEGYGPDVLVFLQCTAPLTIAADIDGTVRALETEKADTAFAAVLYHYFLWKIASDGNAVGINHDKMKRPMRQELAPQYLETGAVYAMKVPGFLEYKHRFFGKTALYEMPAERRHEIDEPVDLQLADILLKEQIRQKSR